jgi:hypothetical protein
MLMPVNQQALHVKRNILNSMKVWLIAFSLLVSFSSCKKKLEIVPLSPYEQTTSYAGWDTTTEYFFALKNYSAMNKAQLDTFVLKRLPQKLLKAGHAVNFCFYRYEKGHIDENFVHREHPKKENLFMEAEAKQIATYSWIENKFINVRYYDDKGYKFSEKRNW